MGYYDWGRGDFEEPLEFFKLDADPFDLTFDASNVTEPISRQCLSSGSETCYEIGDLTGVH